MNPIDATQARQTGLTLTELLIVVALLGMTVLMAGAAWTKYKRATGLTVVAQTFKRTVAQARLRSIYNNVNHFVVLDMANGSLSVVEDSGANVGVYESDDRQLLRDQLENSVALELPSASLPHPLGSGTVSTAWTLPMPVSGGAWGTAVGLMCDTSGRLISVAATPEVIGFGAAVFSDPAAQGVVGIGIEGRSGTVRSYRYAGGSWTEM